MTQFPRLGQAEKLLIRHRARTETGELRGQFLMPLAFLCGDLVVEETSRSQTGLFHSLMEQGQAPFIAGKTLEGLGMDVRRIARFVKQTEADAWVVTAGSRDVLEWFAEQQIPVFALFGTQSGIPIAGMGPDHEPALRRLARLGHRRIVSLSNRGRHEHGPGFMEQVFLDELEAQALPWGDYNLPSWENHLEGFRRCLESLFQVSRPSALIVEEATHFFAFLQFCANRRLRVPEDVSLVCSEHAPSFSFGNPPVAHIR